MNMKYPFFGDIGRLANSGQSKSIVLGGNIHDLFHLSDESRGPGDYVSLLEYMTTRWLRLASTLEAGTAGFIVVVYELNGPLRFLTPGGRKKMKDAWLKYYTGRTSSELTKDKAFSARSRKEKDDLEHLSGHFDDAMSDVLGSPAIGLEALRTMCKISHGTDASDKPYLAEDLIIIIEGMHMLIPDAPIQQLGMLDRRRVMICADWFSDPAFVRGNDLVVMVSESKSQLHHEVTRLPVVLGVSVPYPDVDARRHFISWFKRTLPEGQKLRLWTGSQRELAVSTGGLSIRAMDQLLRSSVHQAQRVEADDVVKKVKEYIQSQLGEGVVDFMRPNGSLRDVVGNARLVKFLTETIIPRIKSSDPHKALPGMAVAGPIGGGKTFIMTKLASELGMPVIILKGLRSKWFGETDVIMERLERTLRALGKVCIFVDEADTQFGGVGKDAHETEKRLTGKIQAMMSDMTLRGKVFWLLMTARIQLLSPDIRRPGRVGNEVVPVLDPEGADLEEFVTWVVKPALSGGSREGQLERLCEQLGGYSAAGLDALRSELLAVADGGKIDFEVISGVLQDLIPPAIGKTRRYQTLQAMLNCRRLSLLPNGEYKREEWEVELRELESMGIS